MIFYFWACDREKLFGPFCGKNAYLGNGKHYSKWRQNFMITKEKKIFDKKN